MYDSVGSKPALVLALNDVLDADAGVGQVAGAAFASGTVDDLAALPARIARVIVEHAGDIVRLLFSTAPLDPAVKTALDEGRARHLAGARAVAQQLEAKKALRQGVTVDEATDTLAALSEVTYVLTLHDDYGWSLDRIETWTAAALKQLILR